MNTIEILFKDIKENIEIKNVIIQVLKECFKEESIGDKITLTIILTNSEEIKRINKKYRNIDKETDVLSFPMYEKEEIPNAIKQNIETILGDIVICISKEYEHSFKRELAYMVVHGFYHLMGYDHIEENDKKEMRKKEENILERLNIID